MSQNVVASLSPSGVARREVVPAPGASPSETCRSQRPRAARVPISEHTRFIQEVRAVFPGARVVGHEWQSGRSG